MSEQVELWATARLCEWCEKPLVDPRSRFCGKRCRQTAHRLRRRHATDERAAQPGRFAYADPPYPGRAHLYADQPSYAGEVDHRALVEQLEAGAYTGWALSTAADALQDILPLLPKRVHRVCAWVKPIAACPNTFGLHNTWEPLLVVRGRQRRPGRRDWLAAQPARGGGDLIGRKPIAFCAWLFGCLGMQPGDELVDVFPGTGVVGKAWQELASFAARADASGAPGRDVSLAPRGGAREANASPGAAWDASLAPRGSVAEVHGDA